MRGCLISVLTILALCVAGRAGHLSAGESGCQEKAAWDYIDSEFRAAASDSTRWERRWHFVTPPIRSEFRLGKPFTEHHLNAPELEEFVRSGDLLGSAFVADISYPLYRRDRFVTTIQVVDSSGTCWFVSRRGVGSSLDSLAVAEQDKGNTVKLVTGMAVGTFVLIAGPGSEPRVYPLMRDEALEAHLDQNKMVSYAVACAILRPRAAEWLAKYRDQTKKEKK
ncbi:MAG TPA: hypothetical protein VF247_12455 [Candidatus Krumholzibacteria bacterium]